MHDEAITSEHTGARIGQLLDELESLRLEMGCRRDARVPMHVSDASPREVYYQAETVFRKADRLCLELGAESLRPPAVAIPGRASPADVLALIDGARARIAEARSRLRLEGDAPVPDLPGPLSRAPGKVPSDVLGGCLLASRQLNAMLSHAFSPGEAHELLMRALAVAARLLARQGTELPPAPALERRKAPREVFQVLWQSCALLHRIMADAGLRAADIHREYVGEEPSDVYDLAALIVAELEFLALSLPAGMAPAVQSDPASPILPAHNFRRSRQLHAAIALLSGSALASPDGPDSAGGAGGA